MDIVLDNAGLELYTDLVLADFLISSGLAARVVLHGKLLPWFVSDTLEEDLDVMLAEMEGGQAGSSGGREMEAGCGLCSLLIGVVWV